MSYANIVGFLNLFIFVCTIGLEIVIICDSKFEQFLFMINYHKNGD